MNAEVTALRRGVTTPRRLLAALAFLTIGLALAALQLQPVSAQDKEKKVDASIEQGVLVVTGTADADTITLRLRAGHPDTLEVDDGGHGGLADIKIKRDRFDAIVVNARDGNDQVQIDESNGAFTDTHPTTLNGEEGDDTLLGGSGAESFDGGDGNDTILGRAGIDVMSGGPGNDFIDGDQGNETALLGDGDDTFRWDPGDGSDVIEGGAGSDTMLFNGAAGVENFDASANGGRLRFFRSAGNIVMDTDDVEIVDLNTLGGADNVVVNDLSATDVTAVNIDLASPAGGAGDGAADLVKVVGTNGVDNITIAGNASGVSVTGLAATVGLVGMEGANDTLQIDTLGGDDIVNSAGLAAGTIALVVN
ncbi:MAG: calcium-binding protein [Tepidiformaceae bacterium]